MQAYLQRKYQLTRQVYTQPRKCNLNTFGNGDTETVELNKSLHGIC